MAEHILLVACRTGEMAKIRYILHGYPHMINAPLSGDGSTALHESIRYNHCSNASERLIYEYGANIHCINDNLETPLHTALRYGRIQVAKLLLKCGADADARDIIGRTPVSIAGPISRSGGGGGGGALFDQYSPSECAKIYNELISESPLKVARDRICAFLLASANASAHGHLLHLPLDLQDMVVDAMVRHHVKDCEAAREQARKAAFALKYYNDHRW